jgi:hypothetical protein
VSEGGKVIFLAFKSERLQQDEMDFLACKVCRNKTFTHTYVGASKFPLVRCAACGQHIGRVGYADDEVPA